MKLRIITLSIMKLRIITLSIMTLSILTLSILTQHNHTQQDEMKHKNKNMALSIRTLNAQ
jgi:hypothetical protein